MLYLAKISEDLPSHLFQTGNEPVHLDRLHQPSRKQIKEETSFVRLSESDLYDVSDAPSSALRRRTP